MNKKEVVAVLNSLEVIESSGGEEAYALVKNNEENRKLLNDVGISSKVINCYGDEETFCILALGFSERYADVWDGTRLIAYEKSVEVKIDDEKSVVIYKNEGEFFLSISHDGGLVDITKLSAEQINEIVKVFN